MPRLCIVTAGHLCSCPRMVKAADALHEAGYRVRVVSTSHLPSHEKLDEHLLRERRWQVTMVRYGGDAWPRKVGSALAQRAADRSVRLIGAARAPLKLVAQAYGRLHASLRAAAAAEPADLYYGGTASALAAAAQAARMHRAPYGLDLEDFHSREQDGDDPAGRRANRLIDRLEHDLFPGAAFLTAASAAIADAYQSARGRRPIPINNVFPLPDMQPDLTPSAGSGLRVYWFSQTIGPDRGLEDAVRAAGMSGAPIELHLRGAESPGYVKSLRALARQVAPQLVIVQHAVEPPDALVEVSRRGHYDVGLALEQTHVFNRTVCLSNKAFTYLLAGLAVAFTDTPGQHALAVDLGEGGFLAPPGDVAALAAGLSRWANDKALLGRARRAAWQAAQRRWRWDHPLEKGALLEAVAQALVQASRR